MLYGVETGSANEAALKKTAQTHSAFRVIFGNILNFKNKVVLVRVNQTQFSRQLGWISSIIILNSYRVFEKETHGENIKKKVLRVVGNTVECTSIGGDED